MNQLDFITSSSESIDFKLSDNAIDFILYYLPDFEINRSNNIDFILDRLDYFDFDLTDN